MKKFLILAAVLAVAALPLLAQSEYPRAQVFGGYSYFSVDTNSSSGHEGLNGWNGQFSYNFNHFLGFTGDFGGYYGDVGPMGSRVHLHDYTYTFGPTLTYRAEKAAPFFHALFGADHADGSSGGKSRSDDSFAMAIGGGLDIPFKSGLGVRLAQADYLRTDHFKISQNNFRISTGIFYNFGHH